MADFDHAFTYLMKWEDDGLTGRVTTDDGGRTRFGIAERFHPDLTATGFFDVMPKDDAVLLAKDTYQRGEWHQLSGDALASQPLANKLLSLGVDLGMVTVIRWAQDCAEVVVDGRVGPMTVRAWNIQAPAIFRCVSLDAEAHYRQRAEEKPHLSVDLKGWVRRAQDPATEVLAA
jgi:lysozyme family protein